MNKLGTVTFAWALAIGAPAFAAPGESSFTPSHLYVPLYAVRLEDGSTNQGADLYRCAASHDGPPPQGAAGVGGSGAGGAAAGASGAGGAVAGASGAGGVSAAADDAGIEPDTSAPSGDCLVDMADNTALAELFTQPSNVIPGHYDRIRIYTCDSGATGYASYVQGQVELSGTTYYTSSGAEVLTTSSMNEGYTRVEYSGCASDIALPQAVDIKDGDSINISAFFSLRDIAWATLTSSGVPGGCTFNAAQTQDVCTAYPIPIAYIGAEAPTVDTYHVTEDVTDLQAEKAGGQLLLLRTAAGVPFGGFSRRLYSATSVQPSVNYDTPIKTIMATPNPNVYSIETWGGTGQNGPIGFYIDFPAFELDTHNGTLLRSDNTMVNYRAVLQPH